MANKIKCTIDSISKSKHKIKPILVSFEHGKLTPKHASNLKCGVYHDNLMKLVVAVETQDNYLYQGTEDSTELTRTFIAIRNKTTNKVRLLEASTIQLSPVIEQTQLPEIAEANPSSIGTLNKSFGSKRSIRSSEQYEKSRTNLEAMSQQLTKAIENVSGELDMSGYKPDTGEFKFLPPRNPEADSAYLVYELQNILTLSELKELEQQAECVLQFPDSYINDDNSIIFCTLLSQLLPGKNTKLIAALLYMECIVRLLNCPRKELRVLLRDVCPFSKLINSNIRDTFTMAEGHKRVMSKATKDKAVCYIIVLGLMVTNFQFDTGLIIQSLQLHHDRLQTLCRAVGVTKMKNDANVVTLKLPLPTIKPSSGRKKKK